uniref:Uncharacterized protein n=1 Tax=Ochrobactrum phage ORM_20 TaxID=2985243 RepID=A0A9N6ZHR5_9VIRU|nr:hypothetical protein ORM20_00196 [Ochrobactrum phage ORM_20]
MAKSPRRILDAEEIDNLQNRLEVVRISSTIIRNHTTLVPNGTGYNNGCHIGNCIQLLLLTFPNAGPNLIRHTVFHDYPEYITGDIVGDAKVKFPELKDIVDHIENKVDDEFKILQGWEMTPYENKILKVVDRLELFLWCREQAELGCRAPRFLKMCNRVDAAIFDFLQDAYVLLKEEFENLSDEYEPNHPPARRRHEEYLNDAWDALRRLEAIFIQSRNFLR